MSRFTVYTDCGDWHDIWAYDAADAAANVRRLTYGRAIILGVERG